MALAREQSVFTYRSTNGGRTYTFDIVLDSLGNRNLRNIRAPNGLITDSQTSVPQSVVDDINRAVEIVGVQSSEVLTASGTASFEDEVRVEVAIAPGTLASNNYRVVYTTEDGTVLKTENKTTTTFDIVAPAAYGEVGEAIDVDWALFVTAAPAVSFSGEVEFVAADNSVKTVTFPSSIATAEYRVIVSPDGFYPVGVSSKTRTGFTITLGIGLLGGDTATVGYDVVI